MIYQSRKKAVLLTGDLLLLALIFVFPLMLMPLHAVYELAPGALLSVSCYILIFYVLDLYNINYIHAGAPNAARFMLASALAASAVMLASGFLPASGGAAPLGAFLGPAFMYSWRLLLKQYYCSVRKPRRLAIVGAGSAGTGIYDALNGYLDNGIRVRGFLDDDPEKLNKKIGDHEVIGASSLLVDMADRGEIDAAVVAITHQGRQELFRTLIETKLRGIEVYDMPSFYEEMTGKVPVMHLTEGRVAFTPFQGMKRNIYMSGIKGLIDKASSLLGLAASLPLMAVTAAAIRADSKGPVLYRQKRVGMNGGEFELLKFRSMRVDAESCGPRWAQQDDPRVTRVGRFIRKARIDEIPQLWNVLKGDMSLIGPRPERPEFVRLLNEEIPFYHLRHSVRPGITGWAQVNYRYGASKEDALEKLQYDLFYIKNLSAAIDLHILMRTVRVVLFGTGAR